MKRLLILLLILVLGVIAGAEDFIVSSAEYVVVGGNVSDTLGRTRLEPDSIRIVVTDSAGAEVHDAWYNSGDAQATLNGDVINFFDQWDDIVSSPAVGIYHMATTIASDAQNDVDLFSNYNYTVRMVTVGSELVNNNVAAILIDVTGINGWAPILDNDSLITDMSTLSLRPAIGDTSQGAASSFDPANDSVIVDGSSLAATSGAIAATTIATDAIGAAELAANSITSSEIADNSIDAGAIAADAIGASELATDAIGAAEIAANAITSSEFTASAAGRTWSNLDTTVVDTSDMGDWLRDNLLATGFSTHAPDAIFRNIDTVHVDSSDIGDWWKNNLSGAAGGLDTLSDAWRDVFLSLLADSIWQSLLVDRDGVAGSFGDSSKTWGATGAGASAVDTLSDAWRDVFLSLLADSVWQSLLADRDGVAGSFGDSSKTWGATGAGVGIDTLSDAWRDTFLSLLSDSVWLSLFVDRDGVAGSFGDSAQEWGNIASGFAVAGDPMTLTAAERGSIEDSVYANRADYRATGFATAGDAMTLTPAERGSIEDSVYANRDDYKATGFATAGDAMTLTPAERGSIEDSIYANRADYRATGFSVAGDAMALTPAERGSIEDSVNANADDYKATGFSTHAPLAIWNIAFATAFGAGSMGDSLNNSSYVQGAAGSVTDESIAHAVWGHVLDTAWAAGSIGDSAKGWGATGAAGTGSWAVYLRFIDTSGTDDTITGVNAIVQNSTGSAITGAQTSGSDGLAGVFNIQDSVLFVAFSGAAYTWPTSGATVTANDTIDVLGYNVAIAAPGNASFAAIHNREEDFSGTAMEGGIVTIKPAAGVFGPWVDTVNGLTFSDIYKTDTTDASGDWSITFLRSDNLTDTTQGWYKVEFRYNNKRIWSYDSLYVPSSGNVNMTDKLAE